MQAEDDAELQLVTQNDSTTIMVMFRFISLAPKRASQERNDRSEGERLCGVVVELDAPKR